MTVPGAAAAAAVELGPPERLHPWYLLTGLGGVVRGAWGLLAAGAWAATQGRWWIVAVMLGAFAILSIGGLLVRWLKTEYRVGAHEIRIDSGLMSRNSRAIPFDRIRDVDIEQGPLQRLLGLAKVRFETGAAGGTKTDDGVLHTISLDRAEAIRRHIRARHGAVASAGAAADEDEAPLFAMDARRVLTDGLFNFSLAVLAGLVGLSQTAGNMLGFDPFSRRFWSNMLEISAPLQALVLAHQIVTVVAGTLLLLLVGSATGIFRTVLREYGFRLDRAAAGLRRRRGLLTLTDVTLPLKRVQAAIITTGPIRNAFNWAELKLQSLAQDQAGKGDHVVAPLAHPQEIAAILAELGWPAGPDAAPWRPISRAFLYIFLLSMIPLVLIGLLQLWWLPPLGIAFLAGIAGASLLRALAWPRTRFALDGERLFIQTGWWLQRRVVLPLDKVQSADVADNFLTRAFGVATVRLGVAGGGGFSDHAVPALPNAEAHALRRAVLARA